MLTAEYEQRLDLVETANRIIEESKLAWFVKVPPIIRDKDDIKTLKQSLGLMLFELYNLKQIDLGTNPPTMDEKIKNEIGRIKNKRINHYENVALIPKSLLKELNGRKTKKIDLPSFFFNYTMPIIAMNDGAMAIKKAEQVRDGQYTVEELNRLAEQTARDMHGYLTRGERIPEKNAKQIGEYTWCFGNLMHPIIEIDNETILYHTIGLGHPPSWEEMYSRGPDGIRYMNFIKEKHNIRVGKHTMHLRQLGDVGDNTWFLDICYPELLCILASSFVYQYLIGERGEKPLTPTQHPLHYIA